MIHYTLIVSLIAEIRRLRIELNDEYANAQDAAEEARATSERLRIECHRANQARIRMVVRKLKNL